MFNGKMKAITFSYDDGATQDARLIYLMNKYGLKGTFNLNSGRLGLVEKLELGPNKRSVSHIKFRADEIKNIYEGHEVAAHTLRHPPLINKPEEYIIEQVEQDRLALSEIVGYEVVGFAYPCAKTDYDSRVANIIKEHTGIKYARTAIENGSFDIQDNLYEFFPSISQPTTLNSKNFETVRNFLDMKAEKPQILYIWGHAHSLDVNPEGWDAIEKLFKMISGKSDVFYGTNSEVLLAK